MSILLLYTYYKTLSVLHFIENFIKMLIGKNYKAGSNVTQESGQYLLRDEKVCESGCRCKVRGTQGNYEISSSMSIFITKN